MAETGAAAVVQPPDPVPFEEIASNLRRGLIVPFLGAGASTGLRLPEPDTSGRKQDWTRDSRGFPPLGGELSTYIAGLANLPDPDPRSRSELPRVASYFVEVASDRTSLRDHLRHVFARPFGPSRIHKLLAANPAPLLIITTNYDDLIEQALEQHVPSRPYHLVVQPTDPPESRGLVRWRKPGETTFTELQPKELPLVLGSGPDDPFIVYKMHGTCDRLDPEQDHYLITEEDYVDFLATMPIPARFELTFRKSRFLFLGYGLGDWNFRVMLRNLRLGRGIGGQAASSRRAWAVRWNPKPVERKIWEAQKVNIYGMDVDDFADRIEQTP